MSGIAGKWRLAGTALQPDGTAMYQWSASAEITVDGDGPKVIIETEGAKSSRSLSYAEKLTELPGGEWSLRYGYESEHDAQHTFFGVTQLTFAADLQSARGSSCNFNGRYVVMDLTLLRS